MFRTKYRIVRDSFLGFEAQFRPWWSPVWFQMGFTNTLATVERAEDYIRGYAQRVVKTVEP